MYYQPFGGASAPGHTGYVCSVVRILITTIGVRERKWEMAERVHRTQIGLLRPNANPNVFVPEKEIVPEKLYQKKICTIKSGR